MQRLLIVVSLVATWLAHQPISCAADSLTVEADFEGASVCVLEIDEATRSGCEKIGTGTSQLLEILAKHRRPCGASPIFSQPRSVSFMPGGDPVRGWPCWWYFRVGGITPGETITLRLRGSTAAVAKQKPLSAVWAMPDHAAYSIDGETWLHTEKGQRQDEWMLYTLKPDAASVFVAWGPPTRQALPRSSCVT